MNSISQNINKSTVRIVCDNGTGTGFYFCFVNKDIPDQFHPFIVTNKHVIEGAKEARLRLKLKPNDQGIDYFDLSIQNLSNTFIGHPDPNVDLTIFPLSSSYAELSKRGLELDPFFFCDASISGTRNLTPVEDIYMTGYPNGLWDEVNNKPITRKGITASDVNLDWNGKKQFMIDMACFGGSSGSPVYVMTEGSFSSGDGIAIGKRFVFLGVLFAGPQFRVDGSIDIVEVPTSTVAISRTDIMMNLGIVIKAAELLKFKTLIGIA
ncbi:serine protease [Leclercia sp. GLN_9]|uniref:S1 family peptidase n=1 Tax=Leclercia sp. GLN_9 TaxID=3367184 RepID=UPI00370C4AAB